MNTYLRMLLVILLAALVIQPTPAPAQPIPTVKLVFDKNFYGPSETFTATATITNASAVNLRYNRLTLSVFPAAGPGTALSKAFGNPGPPVIHQSWFTTILPGTTSVSLSRSLQTLKLNEGVYPAELSLTLAGRETVVDRSYLVVLGPKDRQMPVAVVWNLHQPERRLPDGTFFDNALAGLVANRPENQGLLSQQLSALGELPTVKANLAVSPVLLEQLSSMAAGYTWHEGRSSKVVARDGESAQDAGNWLESLKKIVAGGQAEILTSPYGQSPLPTLAALGWESDALGQLQAAGTASKKILALDSPLPGLYLPGLMLDKRSAPWLVKSNVKYAVARSTAPNAGVAVAKPLPPLDFKLGRRHLTILQSDPEITGWLHIASPEKAGQELTALLAQRLLAGDADKVVTIAPDEAHSLPSPDLLRQVYQALARIPWAKTVTLASLMDQPKSPANLATGKAPASASRAYKNSVERSRRDLLDFTAGVSSSNELRRQLEHQLYVSESIDYWLGNDPQIPPMGKIYADNIHRTIDSEFSKLELVPPSKITFSTKNGKIPVAIVNRAGYPIKARVHLAGKNFVFSDDKKEEVTLMPKENLISYDITAGFVGLSKLKVTVLVGTRTIASRNIEVRVSNMLRYLVVAITTLSIMGVTTLIFKRGRRA
ncbi:MAG: DUF6049 family protein [Actinomycetota bacterium]|nr:DUF6049 family protein [Actinomycetota bacterium]